MGILFWVLWILAVIALITGYAVAGVSASAVIVFICLGLLGWKVFGPVLQ